MMVKKIKNMNGSARKGRLLLTSQGLNTKQGWELISHELQKDSISSKNILIIYEPYFSIEDILYRACLKMGFKEENIILCNSRIPKSIFDNLGYVYVTEGNTFEVMRHMKENHLVEPIRKVVTEGTVYIGSSAGAMIAGTDIELANDFDRNETGLCDFSALGLFDGTVLPHYTKAELKRYIANSDSGRIRRYKNIYSIANGGMLILEGNAD